jgi:hypothetical protein
MTADTLMKALAGLLLMMLVGIPVAVWVLVLVAAARRGVASARDSYADARENRRRHVASQTAVTTASAFLADVPDPVPATAHPAGRWTRATPLDDESAEVIAAMVAGAHPRPR